MQSLIEIIGYAASACIAASLLMVSFVRLRVINLIGCVFFVTYGVFIGAIPIIVTNGFIACVNVFYLVRIWRSDTSGFSYVSVGTESRERAAEFVGRYAPEIRRYYPAFAIGHIDRALAGEGSIYLALKDLRVEGLACFLYASTLDPKSFSFEDDEESRAIGAYIERELYPQHSVYMPVDFITKRFRDLGLVKKLHERMLAELRPDISFLIVLATNDSRNTDGFLRRNGHQLVREFPHYNLYVKTLR